MQYHLCLLTEIWGREEDLKKERKEVKQQRASVEDTLRLRIGIVEEYIEDLRTQTLEALKKVCSPTVYKRLELTLNPLYADTIKRIENELIQSVASQEQQSSK